MGTPDLKPCPFCGGEAEVRDGHIFMTDTKVVTCKKCHVRTTPVSVDHPNFTSRGLDESTRYTPEQATQIACGMWNRRENDSFPRWISVEERLPEETEDVAAIIRHNENVWEYGMAFIHGGSWYMNGIGKVVVTHWMPLPEPTKE